MALVALVGGLVNQYVIVRAIAPIVLVLLALLVWRWRAMARPLPNLGLFLVVETAYVALLAIVAQASLSIALTIFIVGVVLTLPLLPVFLWIVARIPDGWSRRRRRFAAIAASPVLLALFALVLGAWFVPTGLALFLIALPGALALGAFVRLQQRSR